MGFLINGIKDTLKDTKKTLKETAKLCTINLDLNGQDKCSQNTATRRPTSTNSLQGTPPKQKEINALNTSIQQILEELYDIKKSADQLSKKEELQNRLDRVEKLEDEFNKLISDYEDAIQNEIDDVADHLQDKIDIIEEREEDDEEEDDENENENEEDEDKDEDENKDENEDKEKEIAASVSHQPSPQRPQSQTEFGFYAIIENIQRGPYNKIQFKRLAENNLVSESTMVWQEGMSQWIAAKDLPIMQEFFGNRIAPPPVPSVPMGPPPIPKNNK